MKSKTECHLLMYELFVKIKHLPLLSTVNLPSRVYTHFHSFLPSNYKFGTVYTLAYRYFPICSSWTKLHTELGHLKEIFINKCFKRFMDNVHVVTETTLRTEKKPLLLVLPYLGSISLQTGTRLKKSLKTSLTVVSCKYCLTVRLDYVKTFIKDLTSGAVYKLQ